ncbi:MAG: ATP-binding protein, partial [Candidatus Planktophila sp.]|nr:ATP-binding protein [Candidatus Planktophila sp.]
RSELGETSIDIRTRVIAARRIAQNRFAGLGFSLNSAIPARLLRTIFAPERCAMSFLHDELEREHITARGLHKIVRVAWTLADLPAHEVPTLADVTQAHLMRAGVEL